MSREHVISVRLTDAEYNRLSELAGRNRETVSEALRRLLTPSWPQVLPGTTFPGVTWPMPQGWNDMTCTQTAPLNPIMWNVPAGAHADGQTLTISY